MPPEIDGYLARTFWHCVAHRSELPNDRDFLRLEWILGDLILYNDMGTIIAFDNICPHRGNRFLPEHEGNAPLSCTYHGWGYRGGKLRIPKPDSYKPCDLKRVRLNSFHTAWCGDFLFVAIAPRTDLATQLGGLADILTGMSHDISRRHARIGYPYECQWRVAVENALEPDHVPFVHSDTLGSLQLKPGHNAYYERNSVLNAPIGNERIKRGLNRISRFFDVQHNEKSYIAIFIFPFSFLSSTFGYTYSLQNFFPSRNGRHTHFTTRMFHSRLTSTGENEAIIKPFLAGVEKLNSQVFQEDSEICKNISPDFPLDGMNSILSTTEEKIAHFRKCIEDIKKEQSPSHTAHA
ncbi:aromatic ring-hydroxylating dioxygenase subunit alpha [Komagataeibacter sp. FNDCR2]|uniref:aromatic ring-hydroxylating oxygenase subunit alpha n=1 Tax=Komagataeibacter sp. FNDCR2 TaxID=2878682 RepID=UPI001E52BC87|nr:Rieske 2Fe-2S domain-containing protein [Komagataeibacter sp. FNDCR2]MCE2575649.1 Rieske 2Fe-2S domain-containing protein [Komagataeibacter sp. FNDCR2]